MLHDLSPVNGSLDHTRFKGLDRLDLWLAVGLGLVSFGLYLRTLQPGLLPNDSAEFQVLAYTLDHAHTTGYHVYLVLAKLFTFLPVGEIAYRVNLFSAFMGGLTVALVYLNGKVLSGSRWGEGLERRRCPSRPHSGRRRPSPKFTRLAVSLPPRF